MTRRAGAGVRFFCCLAFSASASAAPATAPQPPSAAELKRASKHAATVEAAALAAKSTAEQEQSEVAKLATTHKALAAAVAAAKSALNAHAAKASSAYRAPRPGLKPPKHPELPKVSALKAARTEYSAVLDSISSLAKARAELAANEAQLAAHADAAATAAANSKAAVADLEGAAKLLKSAVKGSAASPEKERSDAAATQLKNARAAASSAASLAQKARTASGMTSTSSLATKQAASKREEAQLEQQRLAADATLKDVVERLRLQSPEVPGCDLRKMPWRDMTYPWLPWGTRQNAATFKAGQWLCDEPNPDECNGSAPGIGDIVPGPDSAVAFGDLDGDGKPEAAVHVLQFCCDVSGFIVMFFKQDSDCHLDYVGSAGFTNANGTIEGGAFVIDEPYARGGENIGLGGVSGRHHQEWRIVGGKLKLTKSVKTVVPLQ